MRKKGIKMQTKSYLELLILGALWGASFLFMRTGSPEFGAVSLILMRASIAAAFLLLLVFFISRNDLKLIISQWRHLLILGLTNTALPFTLFAWATLTLEAGLTATINSTAPMFGAVVAWIWLKDKISPVTALGLLVGFSGVFVLMSGKLSDNAMVILPVLAAMLASTCYGYAACYSKLYASGLKPMVVATGSQVFASLMLVIPGVILWPETMPSVAAWRDVTFLGVGCTGIAYILYFRILSREGVSSALSVTYLVPLFAFIWGWIFLKEGVTSSVILGAITILVGVALTTGVIKISKGVFAHKANAK